MHAHHLPLTPTRPPARPLAHPAFGLPGLAGKADDLAALLGAIIARVPHAEREVVAPVVALALQQLHPLLLQQADELARYEAALQNSRRELVRLRASQQRALQLALHDGLTTLPNRSFFLQRMAQALLAQRLPRAMPEAAEPCDLTQVTPVGLAVLVLDLDGFKAINDRQGHAAGDELLRIVGARLQRAVRGQDMVCRLGGDEFACMLGNMPGRLHLAQLAAKLIDTVAAPVCIAGLQVSVRPSIGIATWPADGNTTDLLLRRADAAMFRAKRERLGHAFFDPACDLAAVSGLAPVCAADAGA